MTFKMKLDSLLNYRPKTALEIKLSMFLKEDNSRVSMVHQVSNITIHLHQKDSNSNMTNNLQVDSKCHSSLLSSSSNSISKNNTAAST